MHDKHTMLKGQKKHIDKEQGKTKHEAPRSVNYRATQNKNNIGTTALEVWRMYNTGKNNLTRPVSRRSYLIAVSTTPVSYRNISDVIIGIKHGFPCINIC